MLHSLSLEFETHLRSCKCQYRSRKRQFQSSENIPLQHHKISGHVFTAVIKPDEFDGAILAKRNFLGGERTNYMVWINPNGTIGFEFNYNNSIRGDLTGSSAVP